MSERIIGMQQWFESPPGGYLLAWEQAAFDDAVADLFGYHAIQVGLPAVDALRANRMPHRWLGLEPGADPGGRSPDVLLDTHTLPFDAASLDLVALPHTLELSVDPHATLREVERVLVPEGRLLILGINPASLWGWRRPRGPGGTPGELIGYRRLRDWLRLLSFEVEAARFGCFRPPLTQSAWLQRFAWMETVGERWWPVFGAVYALQAVKRVRGMRLVGLARRQARYASAPRTAVTVRQRRQGPPLA